MKRTIWILIIIIILLSPLVNKANFVLADSEKTQIYFFSSAICPHCTKEREFLEELKKKYPEIEIKEYEVVYNPENKKILEEFYEKYQVPEKDKGWVPVTFTPSGYFIGFNQQVAGDIENCLIECIGNGQTTPSQITIPIFGQIDLSNMSLPVLTVTLGALDGFNPCAMWILLFLITLLINTRSRKRMLLVGGIFIGASGVVYFLILTAWLNLFFALSYVNLTRILIGAFALGVGGWQIKNFIGYKGVCPVTDGSSKLKDRIKNGLRDRAEKLVSSPFTFVMLGGVIILAFGVNLIEFFCSAGIPAIFSRVLALNQLTTLSYYFYLLLYTFVFMLDDLIIFSIAAITLSKIGFSGKYNYWATLIGGLLMFVLGILLIFKPELLMFG